MKLLNILCITLLCAGVACGQTYNARGTFNGWGETPMIDDGDGTYSLTIPGLTTGDRHDFKIAQNDWASSWPGSNPRAAVDASGELTLYFTPGAVTDGWNPAADRVGYDDSGQFGWEIMGAFNSWDDGIDTSERQMSDLGGGLFSVDYTIATAGSYDYKFRESGSWDIAIGDDFGNSAADNLITTTVPDSIVRFELDLPNGRWNTTIIPEPSSMALIVVGSLAAVAIRRLRK